MSDKASTGPGAVTPSEIAPDVAPEHPAQTPVPRGKPSRKASFAFIFASALMNAVSFGIMIPILPNLIKQFTGGDTAAASEWNVLFATVWGVMQFFSGPMLGLLADRYGRRPVLLISLFGLGVDFLFMAFAPTLWWLFIGRVLNGMTAASFSTANAYLADVTPPDQRAKAFGMMGSAFSFGFIIGPVIGGLLGEHDLRLPFLAAAALTLANWLYGLFILPESAAARAAGEELRLVEGQSGGVAAAAALAARPPRPCGRRLPLPAGAHGVAVDLRPLQRGGFLLALRTARVPREALAAA